MIQDCGRAAGDWWVGHHRSYKYLPHEQRLGWSPRYLHERANPRVEKDPGRRSRKRPRYDLAVMAHRPLVAYHDDRGAAASICLGEPMLLARPEPPDLDAIRVGYSVPSPGHLPLPRSLESSKTIVRQHRMRSGLDSMASSCTQPTAISSISFFRTTVTNAPTSMVAPPRTVRAFCLRSCAPLRPSGLLTESLFASDPGARLTICQTATPAHSLATWRSN